jgi:hypothetical protein
MKTLEKAILNKLLNYSNQKNFDLEVWKIKATQLIRKIFGNNDERLGLIEKLQYDYSSWSLRDKTGIKQADTVKEQARGIIESAIDELALAYSDNSLLQLLKKNISNEEFDVLQNKLSKNEVSESELSEYFSKIATPKKDIILAQLLALKIK